MKNLSIYPGGCLQGTIRVPGDKSITHRALILGSLIAPRPQLRLHNWLQSLDCLATLNALQSMGVVFRKLQNNILEIDRVGLYGLQKPEKILDLGNSGTGLRLLTGVLAAQKFNTIISGDASLCARPMRRIIEPLQQMGALISAENDQYAPLQITGNRKLCAINYHLPVASSQVKSAILLAGLYCANKSQVTQDQVCRNHTELMLSGLQNDIDDLFVPGDISAASFFMVGACIARDSDLLLENVGINPTRSGVIEILRAMGANIIIDKERILNGELSANIRVKYSRLNAITVPQNLIANAIDELPIIAIAAACARGVTLIRGAKELRYKESDRIAMMAAGLLNLGIKLEVFEDGLAINGGIMSGAQIDSGGDHRIAMAFAMAALVAEQPIIIQDTANIATSFPDFAQLAKQAGLLINEESMYA